MSRSTVSRADRSLLLTAPDGRVLDLADRLADLPRLPDIVGEFLALARRDNLTARAFEATLASDPALERWLLRQANSSHAGQVRRIETLAEAMVVLGLERLKRMVYAVCSRALLDRRLHCYDHADQGFWLHAMTAGIVARALHARAAESGGLPPGRLDHEEAFVAGLLHDTGKLLLDEVLPRRGGRRDVTRAEEIACCGVDHAWLSARIAASWRLPASVTEAIAGHHADDVATRSDGAALVACADAVCRAWGVGRATYPRTGDGVDPIPWRPLLTDLGIDRSAWEDLQTGWRPTVAGLAEMLRICRTNPVAELDDADATESSPAGDTSEGRRSSPSAGADRRNARKRDRSRRDRSRSLATRRRGRARRGRR
jgi:HD-like signal output (HDOD) protein